MDVVREQGSPEADGGASAPPSPGLTRGEVLGEARAARRHWTRELPLMLGVALLVTLLVRTLLVQAFYIPSGSMEPTLEVGDRVLVSRVAYRLGEVQRGDVVVFDGTGSFSEPPTTVSRGPLGQAAARLGAFIGVSPDEHDYVKRVIGLPGDRVRCCAPDGRLEVNGEAVDEPYLMPGDVPSSLTFDVVVPRGRLWVMGDHRSDSADSRAHLGDPGGGTVPVKRVVGKVVSVFWPVARWDGDPASRVGP